MLNWDGSLSAAISAANDVLQGLVTAAEADALQRQINTLKEAAQLRVDDVVVYMLEQLCVVDRYLLLLKLDVCRYVQLYKQRNAAVGTNDVATASQVQKLSEENKSQYARLTALTNEQTVMSKKLEEATAARAQLQGKVQSLEHQLESFVLVRCEKDRHLFCFC